MSTEQAPSLLRQRKFLPYFITQFFGAFNDNVFKNVLLLLVAFAGSNSAHHFLEVLDRPSCRLEALRAPTLCLLALHVASTYHTYFKIAV